MIQVLTFLSTFCLSLKLLSGRHPRTIRDTLRSVSVLYNVLEKLPAILIVSSLWPKLKPLAIS